MKQGRRRAAIELLEAWVADNPDDASAWAALGAARFALESWADAEQAASEALRLRPEGAREWCNWGMMLRKLGRLDEAERAQYRALSLEPSYDRARTELRKLHRLRVGDHEGPAKREDIVEM